MELPQSIFWTSHVKLLHALRAANQATLPSLKRDLDRHHGFLLKNVASFEPSTSESIRIVHENKHLLIQNVPGKILVDVRLRQATAELSKLLVSDRADPRAAMLHAHCGRGQPYQGACPIRLAWLRPALWTQA